MLQTNLEILPFIMLHGNYVHKTSVISFLMDSNLVYILDTKVETHHSSLYKALLASLSHYRKPPITPMVLLVTLVIPSKLITSPMCTY